MRKVLHGFRGGGGDEYVSDPARTFVVSGFGPEQPPKPTLLERFVRFVHELDEHFERIRP